MTQRKGIKRRVSVWIGKKEIGETFALATIAKDLNITPRDVSNQLKSNETVDYAGCGYRTKVRL